MIQQKEEGRQSTHLVKVSQCLPHIFIHKQIPSESAIYKICIILPYITYTLQIPYILTYVYHISSSNPKKVTRHQWQSVGCKDPGGLFLAPPWTLVVDVHLQKG